jgi:hypothetical protein
MAALRHFSCGALEEFVDQGLIGLGLLGGEAAGLVGIEIVVFRSEHY